MADITRVLIIASHPAVREEIRTIFQLADGIEVSGEAACLNEAVTMARELQPDVALVDLEMAGQDEDGYTILARLKTQCLAKAVIALTAHEYPAARDRALRQGADAVIIKGADFNSMLEVIQNLK
ncbi:MAG TPA: response regulator transcription factor [Anaerolineaceae bacterium]|nr:response regulator transcription factor [Anaerolineaceae bacterium]